MYNKGNASTARSSEHKIQQALHQLPLSKQWIHILLMHPQEILVMLSFRTLNKNLAALASIVL